MLRYLLLSIIIAAGCSSEDLTKPVKVPPKTRSWSTRISARIVSSEKITPYLRSELESMLVGKTPTAVVEKLGTPFDTSFDSWVYNITSMEDKTYKRTSKITLHWIYDKENWNLEKVEKITFDD